MTQVEPERPQGARLRVLNRSTCPVPVMPTGARLRVLNQNVPPAVILDEFGLYPYPFCRSSGNI